MQETWWPLKSEASKWTQLTELRRSGLLSVPVKLCFLSHSGTARHGQWWETFLIPYATVQWNTDNHPQLTQRWQHFISFNGDFCCGDTLSGIWLTAGRVMLACIVFQKVLVAPLLVCVLPLYTHTTKNNHWPSVTHYIIVLYDQSLLVVAGALMCLWYDPPCCSCSQLYFWEAAVGP